ncbi:MAG: hypothetical protein BWY28_03252 [bacterium ADurb.Bin236]|nr:MAG: hypothetical protein BWY28_03252 [bacterium ADurb.Bin236]HOY63991.1 zf-HC2 domain-containing protein [bacterium]HPN93662.1 zf-HC2 domain-containing protein [bacterium]
MERCEELAELITLLADEALEASDAERAERHLRECAACRAAYEETRAALAALASAPALPEPRPGLARDIADRAFRDATARRGRASGRTLLFKRFASAALAASLVLAVLSAAYLFRRDSGIPFRSAPSEAVIQAVSDSLSTPSQPEDVVLTALGDFPGEISPVSSMPDTPASSDSQAASALPSEPAFRALDADMDAVDNQMSSMWGGQADDLFLEIISLTEEEAEEIYDLLDDNQGQSALPLGVS